MFNHQRGWHEQINDILAKAEVEQRIAESLKATTEAAVRVTVDTYHMLQGMAGQWNIIGVQRYFIGGEEVYLVSCSSLETTPLGDGSALQRCYMHVDVVVKHGLSYEIVQPVEGEERP